MNDDVKWPFTIIDLEQGTPEWHQWRRGGIGASDAPTILGENRWETAEQLRQARQNPSKSTEKTSPAMRRGTELEPEARRAYNAMTGVQTKPLCIQSKRYEWMRCSLDGICLNQSIAVEIKCGTGAYKYARSKGKVPRQFKGQIQHIMAVTGLEAIDFFCYQPGRPGILIREAKDERYIARMISKELSFWQSLANAS